MTASKHPAFDAFVETIATLRSPDGCPWNRAQTHESLEEYLIEEAYEAADAIESGDPDHIREELGDEPLHGIEDRYAYRFIKRTFDIVFSLI